MELALLLQAILALIFVIGLIGASSLLYRRYLLDKNFMSGGQKKRLSIAEQLYLDSKRRLVLVKKDDTEFLILLGVNGETVIGEKAANHLSIKTLKPSRIKSVLKRKKS